MELAGELTVPLDSDWVWAALTDTQMLNACIPGCERVTAIGANAWDIVINVPRGSLQTRFRARLHLTDVQPPHRGTLALDGEGGALGALRGTAQVVLETPQEHETHLTYFAEVNLGGRLARTDPVQVQAVVAEMLKRFADLLACTPEAMAMVAATAPTTATAIGARQRKASKRVLTGLRRWLRRRGGARS